MSEEIPTDLSHPEIAPSDILPEPSTSHRRTSARQIEQLAMMTAQGLSPESMSEVSGIPIAKINQIIRPGYHKTFEALLEGFREKSMALTVNHTFEMIELLPKVYKAINRGLDSEDERVALDAAFKSLREVIPAPLAKQTQDSSAPGVQFNFNNNPQLQSEVTTVVGDITSMLEGMNEHMSNNSSTLHVHAGAEALPSPVSKMQVTDDGEALPEPIEEAPSEDFETQE